MEIEPPHTRRYLNLIPQFQAYHGQMGAGFGSRFGESEAREAPGGSAGDDALRSALARLSVSLDRIHVLLGELDAASHPGGGPVASHFGQAHVAAGADEGQIAARAYRPAVSRTGYCTWTTTPDVIRDSTRRTEQPGARVVYGGGPSAFRLQ